MRADLIALVTLGVLGSACRESTPAPPPPSAPPIASAAPSATVSAVPALPSLSEGAFTFTPRAESVSVGPVGTGTQRCSLYVYAWAKGDKACKVQVNHCEIDPDDANRIRCLSLADERTISCGKKDDACGQQVQCDCPKGAGEKVPDEPGTVHVTPNGVGQTFASDDKKCDAKVTKLGAEGPPPAPCVMALHDCTDASAGCIDRTEMLSCGMRSNVCSRPIKCDCP